MQDGIVFSVTCLGYENRLSKALKQKKQKKKKSPKSQNFLQIHPTFRAKSYLNDEKMLNKIVSCFSPPVDLRPFSKDRSASAFS